jgi:hypothetical protein
MHMFMYIYLHQRIRSLANYYEYIYESGRQNNTPTYYSITIGMCVCVI